MKLIIFPLLISLIATIAYPQTYKPVDDNSKVKFVIKNFGIATGGTFEGLQGTILFDKSNPTASFFDISIDAASIDTDISSRDKELRKAEYFDVKKYPRISFKSTKVTRSNNPEYLFLFGNITIKGVTKQVQFPFKATTKDGGYLFEGEFKLNRRDFGVGGKSLSLGDELSVDLKVFARKP